MQMVTLSARIPAEDMDWLIGLEIQGAVSPSDKIRALISQMRRQQEGTLDYERSLSWLRDLVSPFVTAIRGLENQNRMHSDVLTLTAEWLPQIMATFLSERSLGKEDKKRAIEIEDMVIQRCFQLLTSLLRLAITRDNGCYSSSALEEICRRSSMSPRSWRKLERWETRNDGFDHFPRDACDQWQRTRLLDAVEDTAPEAMMAQAVREVDLAVDEVRAELGRIEGVKYLATSSLNKLNTQNETLAAQIDLAVSKGDEALARAGIARQVDIEDQIPVLQRSLQDAHGRGKELEGYIAALLAKKREMESALHDYIAARATAVSSSELNRLAATHDKVDRAGASFDRVLARQGITGVTSPLNHDAGKLRELQDLARTTGSTSA